MSAVLTSNLVLHHNHSGSLQQDGNGGSCGNALHPNAVSPRKGEIASNAASAGNNSPHLLSTPTGGVEIRRQPSFALVPPTVGPQSAAAAAGGGLVQQGGSEVAYAVKLVSDGNSGVGGGNNNNNTMNNQTITPRPLPMSGGNRNEYAQQQQQHQIHLQQQQQLQGRARDGSRNGMGQQQLDEARMLELMMSQFEWYNADDYIILKQLYQVQREISRAKGGRKRRGGGFGVGHLGIIFLDCEI